MAPLRRVAVAIVALLALQAGGTALAAGPPATPPSAAASPADAWSTNTTIWIELQPDGDARWTVTMTVALEDDRSVAAFRDVADRFEAGESDVLSTETFESFLATASRATGRNMRLRNDSRTATVDGETGRLRLAFTWTNFGQREDSTLRVGDAFDAPGGTWLPRLTADQRLVIEGPTSFDIVEAPSGISIENGTIRWSGPRRFDPSYIAITYSTDAVRTTTGGSVTPTAATPTTGRTTTDTSGTGGSIPLLGAGIVLAILVATALLYSLRGADEADEEGHSGETEDDDGEFPPSSPEPTDDTATDSPEESPSGESDDIDKALLSDEEYVEALIEANGGRMKQADIVTETGWSNAKVSQLLSGMAEDGRVEKLRIGRENLISFPEEASDDDLSR